jgi:hypothetical protein
MVKILMAKPYGANRVIASEAKQSRAAPDEDWIASSLRSSQ